MNSGIPQEYCKVKYPNFEEAVNMCLIAGKNCYMGRSDVSMAFRNVPLKVEDFPLLLLKATHPMTKKTYYFVDKCLPFGSSISCAFFQAVSDSIAFLVRYKTGNPTVNYLDDYFFAALLKAWCDWQLNQFLDICQKINLPVALEKTFWGTQLMTFLGLLLDSRLQLVCVPVEKVDRALDMVAYFLNKKNKKATVKQIQKLCGFLNFLCKCIIPGRTFLRRTYALVSSKLKPHHHVRISAETRMDLETWKIFLEHPTVFCRPFMEFGRIFADDIDMYSDASRNFRLGCGALCNENWTYVQWDENFMRKCQPSIAYLELYGIAIAVLKWIKHFKNRRVYLFTDNKTARDIINSNSSKCKNCMVLMRLIILESLVWNVRVYAKYVKSKDNELTDALSRMDFQRFRRVGPHMNIKPDKIPDKLWPMEKIWMK